jgi:hypothetical protein
MQDSHPVALSWRKSSVSATGDCVEVAHRDQSVFVRDSKQRLPHILEFTTSEWLAFISGVRAGEFDLDALKLPGGQL